MVVPRSLVGGERVFTMLAGEQLPQICCDPEIPWFPSVRVATMYEEELFATSQFQGEAHGGRNH
jgi:hypothetical protein